MLGKYLKVNNQLLPNPVPGTFKDGLNPQENIYFSEGGKRMTNIIRLDRNSWSATFHVTSRWKKTIEDLCKEQSVTSQIGDGPIVTGTLRPSGAASLVANSEYCNGTDGLYELSVIFEGE